MTRGYFIEFDSGNIDAIDAIDNLQLMLNGLTRLIYNDITLSLYSKKISKNMFYVPLNNNVDNYLTQMMDTIITSYVGSLNQSRIDNITLQLKLNLNNINNGTQIKVHSLSANLLRYHQHNALQYIDQVYQTYNHVINDVININQNNQNNEPQWQIVNRPIDLEKNDSCPISLGAFDDNDKYCVCSKCDHNFDYEAFVSWYNIDNADNKLCPLCRNPWDNFKIYVNKELDDNLDDVNDAINDAVAVEI